jgi:hypothetical protein
MSLRVMHLFEGAPTGFLPQPRYFHHWYSLPSGPYLFVFRKGITANIGPQRHHESLMDAKLLIHANIQNSWDKAILETL